MQAIEVKFYTDVNANSKAKASCQAGNLTAYVDELRIFIGNDKTEFPFFNDQERIAYEVALRLAKRFNWDWSENYGSMVIGSLPNGNYVFVFTGMNDSNVIK